MFNYRNLNPEMTMDIQSAIRAVTERRDLSSEDMYSVMHSIMTGVATPAQIGGLLIGLTSTLGLFLLSRASTPEPSLQTGD